jgi:hypothetical protein
MGDEAKAITAAAQQAFNAVKSANAAGVEMEALRQAMVRMRKHVDGLVAAKGKLITKTEKLLEAQESLIKKNAGVLARQERQATQAAKKKKKKR